MKGQFGVGFIPYEIGDTVTLKNSTVEFVIEDIKMIQYIKDKKIEFEILLGEAWYPSTEIEKRIIK